MLRRRSTSLQYRPRSISLVCTLAVFAGFTGHAQRRQPAHSTAEMQTGAAMEQARVEGPLALRAFLYEMPKGGDLHNHLSGAVYAETRLRDAAEDGMCVDTASLTLKGAGGDNKHPGCGQGSVAAADLPKNQQLYNQAIDAFSMRTFVPTSGDSGHDHFFATFDHFGGIRDSHFPEWVDEVAERAAAQNEQYLELMQTPAISTAIQLATQIGYQQDFAAYRARMLQGEELRSQVRAIREQMDRAEQERGQLEHCGASGAKPACQVTVRYLFQVLRNMPREAVFGQILLGFEVASADLQSATPHYVGINLVQPEDWYYSMADYQLHMRMIAALRPFYPKVKVALHAGELAPGLVPPEGLSLHVRSAVETAGAQRVGHGVDVMYETDPNALLREMAARHVLVEINLTSNDVILNIKGDEHPLPLYLRYDVPLALSTDDEGVSRIDLTHEYERAAETYHLSYLQLKEFARNSIEYSFLDGESLWVDHNYRHAAKPCQADLAKHVSASGCSRFLATSERARQQWELELRFTAFEAREAQRAFSARASGAAGKLTLPSAYSEPRERSVLASSEEDQSAHHLRRRRRRHQQRRSGEAAHQGACTADVHEGCAGRHRWIRCTVCARSEALQGPRARLERRWRRDEAEDRVRAWHSQHGGSRSREPLRE